MKKNMIIHHVFFHLHNLKYMIRSYVICIIRVYDLVYVKNINISSRETQRGDILLIELIIINIFFNKKYIRASFVIFLIYFTNFFRESLPLFEFKFSL